MYPSSFIFRSISVRVSFWFLLFFKSTFSEIVSVLTGDILKPVTIRSEGCEVAQVTVVMVRAVFSGFIIAIWNHKQIMRFLAFKTTKKLKDQG